MKLSYLTPLIIVFTIFLSCTRQKEKTGKTSVIFAAYSNDMEEKISLWINDTLTYKGKFKPNYNKYSESEMLLGYANSDIITVRIKVGKQDTTFLYSTINIDHIIVAYSLLKVTNDSGPSFFIWNNHDRNNWIIE